MVHKILGTTIDGKFRVSSLLGEGGLGSVYKAEQPELSRSVAIKILHLTLDSENLARFEREARILGTLDHPHIVKVFSFGVLQDGAPYLAMEYLEGKTLASALESGPLDWRRATRIAIQLCHALSAAHKNGIVHRDIKPHNILLLDHPEPDFVKLLDFGLSRDIVDKTAAQKLTQTGALVGSIYYMSPEACSGQKVDAKSDMYSLGCVLYECLAGRPPLESENAIGMLHQHKTQMPQPLSKLPHLAEMPKELELAMFKSMQKDRSSRFTDMDQFAETLKKILEGRNQELTLTGVQILNKPTSHLSKQIPIAVLGIMAVVLSGTYIYNTYQREEAKTAQPKAVRPGQIEKAKSLLAKARRANEAKDYKKTAECLKDAIVAMGAKFQNAERNEANAKQDLALLKEIGPLCEHVKFYRAEIKAVDDALRNITANDKDFFEELDEAEFELAEARICTTYANQTTGSVMMAVRYSGAIIKISRTNKRERCNALLKEFIEKSQDKDGNHNYWSAFFIFIAQGHMSADDGDMKQAAAEAAQAGSFINLLYPIEKLEKNPAMLKYRLSLVTQLFKLEQRLPNLAPAKASLREIIALARAEASKSEEHKMLGTHERYNYAIETITQIVNITEDGSQELHNIAQKARYRLISDRDRIAGAATKTTTKEETDELEF